MPRPLILLSIPGLRQADLAALPQLGELMRGGESATLVPHFPAFTCPVQANMTTGRLPAEHGVVANGFYDRDRHEVEMWTAWNECIQRPQVWDLIREQNPQLTTAVWFPLHSKGCGADSVCTPAPIHNPDGSESLWCYTRPSELYGELRDALGHFPLQHFWGPAANIRSTAWIVDSAIHAAERFRPNFWYIYLPHLDYAAQQHGPDAPQAATALGELDEQIGRLGAGCTAAYGGEAPLWLAAGEYAIHPVDHVLYPNRVLREAGLLAVREEDDGEWLDFESSQAWALADHQLSHVFVRDADPAVVRHAAELFRGQPGVAEVLVGKDLEKYGLQHERSGELLLVSTTNSWQAYYYWLNDTAAPRFARTVDIHRKPGYDPVELHFDPDTRSIPLDATLVRGSHGAPPAADQQQTVLLASDAGLLGSRSELRDTHVAGLVLEALGLQVPEGVSV